MGMALAKAVYGRDSDEATAMKLVTTFGLRPEELPAFNSQVASLNGAYMLCGRGKWPHTFFQGPEHSVLDEALRFDPCRRPTAENIVQRWGSQG